MKAMLVGAVLAVGCSDVSYVPSGESPPDPIEATFASSVRLEMETGALLSAECPDGFSVVGGACELDENALLFSERFTGNGYECDVWNEDDVVARAARVVIDCESD